MARFCPVTLACLIWPNLALDRLKHFQAMLPRLGPTAGCRGRGGGWLENSDFIAHTHFESSMKVAERSSAPDSKYYLNFYTI